MTTLYKPNAILTRPVKDVTPETPEKTKQEKPPKGAGKKETKKGNENE